MGSLVHHNLPAIDFTNRSSSTQNDVVSALEEYGCFVALYDSVSLDLHHSVFDVLKDLFDLPTETKMQNKSSKPLYGYVGQIPIVPLYESMGIDDANTLEGMQNFTKVMWPQGNDNFSETSMQFARTVAELDCIVAKMMFESYGIEKYSGSHIDSATYLLRYLKYRTPNVGETNMAFPSHTDKSFMTILYQNQISGLEIKKRDGEWISVEFPPKSFVVMAGDACQAWSNGRVLSPNHRVTMNKDGNKTRYTIALFSFLSKNIEVPEELVDDEHPIQYKPFVHVDLLNYYATDHGRKSQNILKDFCGV